MHSETPVNAHAVDAQSNEGDSEDSRNFLDNFVTRKDEIMLALVRLTCSHVGEVLALETHRDSAEKDIRYIEVMLALDDNAGLTRFARANVDVYRRRLSAHEHQFIVCQHNARAYLKQFEVHVTELDKLFKQLVEWIQQKDSRRCGQSTKLVSEIDYLLNVTSGYAKATHANIEREPSSTEDQWDTPQVIEFREKLAEERSSIRANLTPTK